MEDLLLADNDFLQAVKDLLVAESDFLVAEKGGRRREFAAACTGWTPDVYCGRHSMMRTKLDIGVAEASKTSDNLETGLTPDALGDPPCECQPGRNCS